jgi:hypothetical protein
MAGNYNVQLDGETDARVREAAAREKRSPRQMVHRIIERHAGGQDGDRPATNEPYAAHLPAEPDAPRKAHAQHNPAAGVPHGPAETCGACAPPEADA